jgi:hypothetical protein
VGTLALTAGVLVPRSEAWWWDPHVTLNGTISCPWTLLGDRVQWAWVSASDGESGWASLGAPGKNSAPYKFNFSKVPSGGMTVTVTVGCSAVGQRQANFGVKRPAVGNYATVNISWGF